MDAKNEVFDNTVFSLKNWKEKIFLTVFLLTFVMATYSFYKTFEIKTLHNKVAFLEGKISILEKPRFNNNNASPTPQQ